MQESCTYGSVRGAPGNGRPYRDTGMRPTAAASGEGLMKQTLVIIILASFAGALMPPGQETLAGECCVGGFAKPAAYSSSWIRTKGWIELHRPDGQLVHIQVVQILVCHER